MKLFLPLLIIALSLLLQAQQNVVVISRCGGADTIMIPTITDNDLDGMDDALEQKLLDHFMPAFFQFDDESCPGPALDGTGDSNLVVCHITPIPGQYAFTDDLNSLTTHPAPLVADTGLVTGLVWYEPIVMVNAALLYGEDCGLFGHTADVEGFSFSLKYTGVDSLAGWMYDTTLQNWMGVTIQTTSHAGTLCDQTETGDYKSTLAPNGYNTIYASPDKHGNYLTISKCGSSIICNPGCNGTQSMKAVKPVNIGEPDAPLVSDLGVYYTAYIGEDPWSTSNFLDSEGGNAGRVREKMLKLSADFILGHRLNMPVEICDLYRQCYSCGDSIYDKCVLSGDTITPGTAGFNPWYHCGKTVTALTVARDGVLLVYPVPADKNLRIVYSDNSGMFTVTIYDDKGRRLKQMSSQGDEASIDISSLPSGFYLLQLATSKNVLSRKLIIQ